MDVERARAVAHVASVAVDTAKVEIDYLRVTGHDHSSFLDAHEILPQAARLPVEEPSAHNPFPVSARHRLNG